MKDAHSLSTIQYLPAVHRLRDAQQGGPLKLYCKSLMSNVQHVSANVRQMYDDWFIETCQPEIVPISVNF